ncbi:MAG: multifunctional CCA tRNA nucleotidyl transferase/2'3'-cyclic phosphodiesterase/2'nucleotidase/phosphatase [Gammaproteobacteria bacterium]|nr:multifunctional CCA tRNA nucleotidyl transferase/2'3'-cyclic phosphodiesterase/2'nucleotidase/phosphatase [Gammaproteobacteria bacterium]
MKEIYLVGGAVRDALLDLPVKEKDYVVVGATSEEMLQLGYRQVGKDFPVFLHPKTHEEYALARMERKVSRGYTGFTFDASPSVTLEEDLLRRDLTINAIAQKISTKELIDPYHGQADLEKKLLRHVSPAFVEDPVRVLRVARFAARFASLGFTVAPETNALMKEMVKAGEVDALVAERVWKELERGLQEKNPEVFFTVLSACDALPVLFPDLTEANFTALKKATSLSEDPEIRFAALLQSLTPEQINALCGRYRVPGVYKELALLVSRYGAVYSQALGLNPEQLLNFFQSVDIFRREARFQKFLTVCEAIGLNGQASEFLRRLQGVLKAVNIQSVLEKKLSGEDLAKEIRKMRLDVIRNAL